MVARRAEHFTKLSKLCYLILNYTNYNLENNLIIINSSISVIRHNRDPFSAIKIAEKLPHYQIYGNVGRQRARHRQSDGSRRFLKSFPLP